MIKSKLESLIKKDMQNTSNSAANDVASSATYDAIQEKINVSTEECSVAWMAS